MAALAFPGAAEASADASPDPPKRRIAYFYWRRVDPRLLDPGDTRKASRGRSEPHRPVDTPETEGASACDAADFYDTLRNVIVPLYCMNHTGWIDGMGTASR